MKIGKSFKIFFKLVGIILITLIVGILIDVSILANPRNLFDYELQYGRYSIYSDKPIPADLLNVLDDVENRISILEIFQDDFAPNLFICNDEELYSIFTFLAGLNSDSQGMIISLFNNSFINKAKVDLLKYYNDSRIKHSHLTGDIAHTISHELVHNLIADHFGFWGNRKLARWKVEGYCEYGSTSQKIRSENLDDLKFRTKILFEDDLFGASEHSKFYYKSQLLVEYLMEFENFTVNKLFDKSYLYYEADKSFMSWYYQKNQ